MQSFQAKAEDKTKYLQQLDAEIGKNLKAGRGKQVSAFANAFFLNVAPEEFAGKKVEDVYGQALTAWKFVQSFDGSEPKISIANPEFGQHGWQSNHTVVMILAKDSPFLVDSTRMELTRQEINIHSLQSIVYQAKRNAAGEMEDRTSCRFGEDCSNGSKGYHTESLIYFEIDRLAGKQVLQEIVTKLGSVLADVEAVVTDFQAMSDKVGEIVQNLKKTPPPVPKGEIKESTTFLNWLKDQNFTFLGYEEFDLVKRGKKRTLRRVKGSELGLVKRCERLMQAAPVELSGDALDHIQRKKVLSFAKSGTMSTVHRPAYPDYVYVRKFDKDGEVCGEYGFLGLYTLPVYTQRTADIPVIGSKVEEVIRRSGLYPASHEGKELRRVLESYPRDELFQTDTDLLFATTMQIAQIKERQQTRLFVRKDHYGKFFSCMVYMPRETYNTEIRQKIQHILCREFKALNAEFTTYFGESVLVRTQFVLRTDPSIDIRYDSIALEREIVGVTRSWQDELSQGLIDKYGEEQGIHYSRLYHHSFPSSYRDHFPPRTAVSDIGYIESLSEGNPLAMRFYQQIEDAEDVAHFTLYHHGVPLPLSDIIPILENMGLKVIGEHPYHVFDREGIETWVHDFNMSHRLPTHLSALEVSETFTEAFNMIWQGHVSNDLFNQLVLAAGFDWREVSLLRAGARYMKQIRMGLSQQYIADTLLRNLDLTRLIVQYFNDKFDPAGDDGERDNRLADIESRYLPLLDEVASLSEDRVLRTYLDLNRAILRTNFFQLDADGVAKNYFSFKLDTQKIPDIPLPRPMFEIFVYSNRVEGVHLRGGKVARGGLRWSDRFEDYRTEVLGLVKAQQVKNAVIVPVGAKGGFIAKNAQGITDREAFLAEGIECYKIFISGLLDVTDNLVDDQVVPPQNVVRHDPDDPYLVVAADKGTATFSDIANGLAEQYGFWLGDAFASGGSQGYDHKGMGITAKGAWVSVQRHFRERGLDVQREKFSVIGIGDMAGDVFGNGMLLSEHIQLTAAFNHLHIFVDPNPDPAKSYAERKRLFETPRTSWADYEQKLISKGGGIFLRTAKSIPVSAEMKKRFGINAKALTPTEFIHSLLKAPVDLIWNGGIGTYVKGGSESHADVGDKANDAIRVNGAELRAKVFGEGGNLGMTQLGRVEFCLAGGACNTDFIDNAGGVDCSDHEVNVKILLGSIVASGDLTEKLRNKTLVDMTDEVSSLVLQNNYRQVQAISIAELQALQNMGEYRRFINGLEEEGKLNRELEFLPVDEALAQRGADAKPLTRPELSVLISYAKSELKESLVETAIAEDGYLSKIVETAFPSLMTKKYKAEMYEHKLRREIIATQLANDVVNQMGICFVTRMLESTGESVEQVLRAYVIARDALNMPAIWRDIEALDNQVTAQTQLEMMTLVMRLVRHATRWLLKHRLTDGDMAKTITGFSKGVQGVGAIIQELLYGEPQEEWEGKKTELMKAGVPEALATSVAGSGSLFFTFDIVDVSTLTDKPLVDVAKVFFCLADKLNMHWFRTQINHIAVENHWHAKVRDAFRDDVDWQLSNLTKRVLQMEGKAPAAAEARVDFWMKEHQQLLSRWQQMQRELRSTENRDISMYAVAIRELSEMGREG